MSRKLNSETRSVISKSRRTKRMIILNDVSYIWRWGRTSTLIMYFLINQHFKRWSCKWEAKKHRSKKDVMINYSRTSMIWITEEKKASDWFMTTWNFWFTFIFVCKFRSTLEDKMEFKCLHLMIRCDFDMDLKHTSLWWDTLIPMKRKTELQIMITETTKFINRR